MEKSIVQLISAFIDDYQIISIYFSTAVDPSFAQVTTLFKGEQRLDFSVRTIQNKRLIINTERLNIKQLYHVEYAGEKVEVVPYNVLDNQEFYYTGDDLGLTYQAAKSVFKVFAPTATAITLNLYKTLEAIAKETFSLTEGQQGVWSVEIAWDLKGQYYAFSVEGALSTFDPDREVLDPYATCVIGKTGKALIIDLQDYSASQPSPLRAQIGDSIIYEIHLRDISIDSSAGCQQRGQYLALTEENTYLDHNPDSHIKTLLGHLEELGVNTIQILPLQDFDNQEFNPQEYGWGYMPRFFNTPDGCYASDWKTDAKIRELKQLIDVLHQHGFKVILDVVYNHTAEGFSGSNIFSFNGFAPYYYYRLLDGLPSNGSACGNEFRSESAMGRKFILDSLKLWTTFYGFDGYRVDLMGLIDIATVTQIIADLKKIKPDFILYGEPWFAITTPIHPTTKGMQKNQGFSVFNDDFRDAIKGNVFFKPGKGYVQSSGYYFYDPIIQGILGSINTFAAAPIESLNYVEVHDNNTLFDKLYFSLTEKKEFSYPEGELLHTIVAMHRLSAFIVLMSQGIPVLHLGQDFLRTKLGVENSFDAGDAINKIDWNRKQDFYDTFVYYKNLIEIRHTHPLLRISTEIGVREAIDFNWEKFSPKQSQGIAYQLAGGKKIGDSAEKMLFLLNPYPQTVIMPLKESWKKLLVGSDYFRNIHPKVTGSLVLPPISGSILFQD